MELTGGKFSLSKVRDGVTGSVLPVGILILIAMMVLPLPTVLLDMFFVLNIVLSLVILMVAMHTYRPLDFSSFPSLLLIATVLRLSLNVASTRIVLSEGHTGAGAAGVVIQAFGDFVVAGNFTVGIFVFIILVIINLVVITKGAGRVSEVSARFTLDAMPGKQMAIDADLNAGILSSEEATVRRADVAKEADFYGAMDGASKFVKGDAVAGLMILAINIVGGLIIGVTQHDIPVGEAAQTYILLSIGDGLVAQIPSLLLSIAAAIIVTRVSDNTDMAEHMGKQIAISRAWIPVAGIMFMIGIVPGMPTLLFMVAAAAAAIAARLSYLAEERRANGQEDEAEVMPPDMAENPDLFDLQDITDNSAISIQLGYGLLDLVDEEKDGPLVRRITAIRREVSRALGFVVPTVRLRDDLSLKANQYRIRIGQTIVAEDVIYADRKLALAGSNSTIKMEGIDVKDPSFGMDATWIMPRQEAEAEANDYVVIQPDSVMATHLSQIITKHAGELIGQDDVQMLLDNLAKTAPQLVQSIVPKLVPLHNLTGILRELLRERIPISDLRRILEVLPGLASRNLSVRDTAEALRPALAGLLIQQVAPLNQPLPVITLSSDMEHVLITTARQSNDGELMLESGLARKLLQAISETNERLAANGQQAVMVVAPQIRRQFSDMVRQHLPDTIILSFNELPDARKVDVVATLNGNGAIPDLPPAK